MIESVNNERVKCWTKLQDKKYRDEVGLFLIEGEHLVEEASTSGVLKEVIILDGNDYDYEPKTYVSENVMKKITSLTNAPKIIGIAYKIRPRKINGRVLLLDRVSDPGNLGTIIRSSIAFGIDTLVIGSGTVSLYNPKVIRATEGLIFHLNIIEENLETVLTELKNEDYKIYSTNVNGGTNIRAIEFPEKTAIIMGNEGAGVSEIIDSYADEHLYIEMKETCESLNVGVATSIILYELNK